MNRLIYSLVALSVIGAGCVPLRQGGTTHYLVIGFGMISVPTTNFPAAQVIQSHAIGLSVSDQPGIKVGIGYAANTTVKICTNENLLVEVSARPGHPLKVKAQ